MRAMRSACLLGLALLASAARAETHVVAPDGSGDFATIQAAIDAAQNGDRIELLDGTFRGDGNRDFDYGGKVLVVISASNDPALVRLECQGLAEEPHRAVRFTTGEGSTSVLEAVTVVGGYQGGASDLGGAVFCLGASPTIRGCRFEGNYATFGGALGLQNSASPTVVDCEFAGNSATRGGAVFCQFTSSPEIDGGSFTENHADRGGALFLQFSSSPGIAGCRFANNVASQSGGALYATSQCAPMIVRSVFESNGAVTRGGAMYVSASTPTIQSCTFFANAATGGAGITGDLSSQIVIERTILANSTSGEAVLTADAGSHATLSCCDLFANAGGNWIGSIAGQLGTNGNLSADPLFCDSGELTIASESPCAAFSPENPTCDLVGAKGPACGNPPAVLGASWGTMKLRFDSR